MTGRYRADLGTGQAFAGGWEEYCRADAHDGVVYDRTGKQAVANAGGQEVSAGEVIVSVISGAGRRPQREAQRRVWRAVAGLRRVYFLPSAAEAAEEGEDSVSLPPPPMPLPNAQGTGTSAEAEDYLKMGRKQLAALVATDSILAQESESRTRWAVLSDDDSFLAMPRYMRLLSLFDSSRPVAVGGLREVLLA